MKRSVSLLFFFVFLALLAGFICYPGFYQLPKPIAALQPSPQEPSASPDAAPSETPSGDGFVPLPDQGGIVIDESGSVGDGSSPDASGGDDGALVDSWDDGSWDEEDSDDGQALATERDPNSYMPEEQGAVPQHFLEHNVPVDPKQMKLPGVYSQGELRQVRRRGDKLAEVLAKEAKESDRKGYYHANDVTSAQWANAEALREQLLARVTAGLAQADSESMWNYLREPANRLDVARLLLIEKAGAAAVSKVAQSGMGGRLLEEMGNDLEWMYGLLYSGPTQKLDVALTYLAAIYARHSEDWHDRLLRRVATTTALEFAREGWPEKEMLARCSYYYNSARQGRLNVLFDSLQYWETRLVTGCTEYDGWGSVRSLTWQRDNVRLPVQGYLNAYDQVQYRLVNVAGDSIFTGEYLAPIRKYTRNITALAHREMGGVCGACSHYGAYGALAAGLPAMTMGEPGHCAYVVRVNGKWEKSYTIYWQHGMHKTFWGETDWDFLELMQQLYSDRFRTLASDQMLALAELLASQRKVTSAATAFFEGVVVQPLHWEGWLRYTGYLKKQGPMNKSKWREAHDLAVSTMAETYHNASAILLRKYVYPTLLPLTEDPKERTKMFAAFFDQCEDFGTNRWDVAPLLNMQMDTFSTDKERISFMKATLKTLMSKPDYASSALAWGLDYIGSQPKTDESEELNEDFYKLVISALSRTRATGKNKDAAWASLGEAMATSADNKDRRAFQAIGKLALRKFRHNFPRNRFRFRAVSGKVVSSTGLIQTATTLTEEQRAQACLHWGVLQRTGGRMPGKFEGDAGVIVELEKLCEINGAVCLLAEDAKTDRNFRLESSEDGQNWQVLCAKAEVKGPVIRFVGDGKQKKTGRFVRMTREGAKYEPDIVGFYVYGRPMNYKKKRGERDEES